MIEDMPKFADLASAAATTPAKRRGWPPKDAKAARTEKPKKKRKYTGRKVKAAPVAERAYSCFLDEEGGLQLCRTDGEGEPIQLTAADALAISAFVEKHRAALEA